jgi:drug/metabolite transporter (DMT)-like permease
VVGSVAVFLLWIFVLQRWTASRAAYVMVLIPFFAVALSAWLDHEPVKGGLVIGGLIVLAGVYFGALRPQPSEVPVTSEPRSHPRDV